MGLAAAEWSTGCAVAVLLRDSSPLLAKFKSLLKRAKLRCQGKREKAIEGESKSYSKNKKPVVGGSLCVTCLCAGYHPAASQAQSTASTGGLCPEQEPNGDIANGGWIWGMEVKSMQSFL